MADPADWYDGRHAIERAIEAKLRADFAPLLDLADEDRAPTKRVRCPDGHIVGKVRLMTDDNGHPWLLVLRPERSGLRAAEPIRGESTALRIRAICPDTDHHYDGTHTTSRLVQLYALAHMVGSPSIILPS